MLKVWPSGILTSDWKQWTRMGRGIGECCTAWWGLDWEGFCFKSVSFWMTIQERCSSWTSSTLTRFSNLTMLHWFPSSSPLSTTSWCLTRTPRCQVWEPYRARTLGWWWYIPLQPPVTLPFGPEKAVPPPGLKPPTPASWGNSTFFGSVRGLQKMKPQWLSHLLFSGVVSVKVYQAAILIICLSHKECSPLLLLLSCFTPSQDWGKRHNHHINCWSHVLQVFIWNLFRKSCGNRANKCVLDWLKNGAEPNILITDFVLEDPTTKEILALLMARNKI